MNIRLAARLILALAACLATSGALTAHPSGPAASPSPSASPEPTDRTVSGEFRSSDGSSGTFVETYAVTDTTVTDTVVYTLADSTTTSTETLTTTLNANGTKTVVYSDLGFGATAAFASTTLYSAGTHGSAVGTGTYTAADGTTGVLAAVTARNRLTCITSTDFTSAAGVMTRQVRLEEKAEGSDAVKTLAVDASGTLTATTITRFGGMHHQHP